VRVAVLSVTERGIVALKVRLPVSAAQGAVADLGAVAAPPPEVSGLVAHLNVRHLDRAL